MRLRNLVLSIALGAAVTIGLIVALGSSAVPVQAQPAPAPAAPTIDHSDAISDALSYLKTQQRSNGSFNDSEFTTVRAVLAIAAARRPIGFVTSISGYTPLDYLATRAITYTHDAAGKLKPGTAGQLAVAVVAGDGDPYDFGGMNIIHELTATYDAATGAYSTTASPAGILNQPWAILGLAAAQEAVPEPATDFLIGLQNADGGWGWGLDPDYTALALQALLASGSVDATHARVQEGLAFLRDTQLDSGGWGWGGVSVNADSTAIVIQALAAAGYTPATESWAHPLDPHAALLGLQQTDGHFDGYDAVLATADAIPGLAEMPLPILGQVQRANRALTWMNERQNADGSWSSFGSPDPGATCDAVLAYAAAGFDPHTVRASGGRPSAMDYLSSTASSFVARSADSAGKLALAVDAAGEDVRDFGGVNIVHVLTDTWYSPTLGTFGDADNSWHQAFGMLGLAAAGEPVPISATQRLKAMQNPGDGNWADAEGDAKPDSTGLAMQALIAVGVPATDTSIVSGTLFLYTQYDAQGSWGYVDGATATVLPSANATAYAMQGLLAAGEDLVADKWLKDGHSPYDALAALQKPDGPIVLNWSLPDDDGPATWRAVPALLGRSLPLHHAGIVVDYGDGSFETACVSFSEPTMSGLDLLDRSGIPNERDANGLITRIGDVGCPAMNPWCVPPYYWSYWHQDAGGTWQVSPSGAGDSTITDGSVDGFAWVDWNMWPAPPPGITPTLDTICGSFDPFVPVHRGTDPDRMVALPPISAPGNSVAVTIPFGSDLNASGAVTLEWRIRGEASWTTATSYRADGYYTATIPVAPSAGYELRTTFTDPDLVQYGSIMADKLTLPMCIYLPLVVK